MDKRPLFQDYLAAGAAYGEQADCGVRAVAVVLAAVTGDSPADAYRLAHTALRIAGRRDGEGAFPAQIGRALAAVGLRCTPVSGADWSDWGRTSRTLARGAPRGRYFIIYTNRHVAAFNGNELVDWTASRTTRVRRVWEITVRSC